MKKGIACVAVLFATLFALAACDGSNPLIDAFNPSIVVITNEEGVSIEVAAKDVKNGTTKPGTKGKPVTKPAVTAPDFATMLPKNTDPDDPFLTGGNNKPEVIVKETMPTGKPVEVEKDAQGKPKMLLLRDGTDGKTLASGLYTMECTLTMDLGDASAGTVSIPMTLVANGDKYSMTLRIDPQVMASSSGTELGESELQAFKQMFGNEMQIVCLNDGQSEYFILPTMGVYGDYEDMFGDGTSFTEKPRVEFGEKKYVKTTKVEMNGKTYTVEEYKDDTGKILYRYYFIGQYLKRFETFNDGSEPTIIDVKIIKSKADANALKLRKNYINMSEFAAGN